MNPLLAAGLLAAAGCFHPTYHDPKCGPNGECPSGYTCNAGTCVSSIADDALLDSDVDGPDAPPADAPLSCVGAGAWELCFTGAEPTTNLPASGTINTDTSAMCRTDVIWTSPSQPSVCVLAAKNITISTTVTGQGSRPLVLLATESITLTSLADVDVASHHGFTATGAGSQPASCGAFAGVATSSSAGGGGGAGGSFMSIGGNGGAGGNTAPGGIAANADSAKPAVLRGGCAGQTGGDAATAGTGGLKGNGGGAVYMVARNSIALQGVINASGAGANGGAPVAGGGGGGGGGMIVLWAPTITATNASAAANGGGGGGGGGGNTGQQGFDPVPSSPAVPANGGSGASGNGCSGNSRGGDGAAGSTIAAVGVDGAKMNTCGGGGGGGGLGYIQSNIAISGLTASPAVAVAP